MLFCRDVKSHQNKHEDKEIKIFVNQSEALRISWAITEVILAAPNLLG